MNDNDRRELRVKLWRLLDVFDQAVAHYVASEEERYNAAASNAKHAIADFFDTTWARAEKDAAAAREVPQ
jgi:hypothetical protein